MTARFISGRLWRPAHDSLIPVLTSRFVPPLTSSTCPLLSLSSTCRRRTLHLSTLRAATSTNASERSTPRRARNLHDPDRGPTSKEDTQTDFSNLNVLNTAPAPSTSIDVCAYDGFVLDSGLRVSDGDGVILVGGEAFVWRPWLERLASQTDVIVGNKVKGTGGLINSKGQFEVDIGAWGLLNALWPRPDILIVGTGPSIRPLAPSTRQALQELGMRIEVLDTRNAASQFNLLATERGIHEVAAALVPIGFGQ